MAMARRRNRKRGTGNTLGGLGEGGLERAKRSRGGRLLDSVVGGGGGLFESKHLELESRPGRAHRKRTKTGERVMMERLAKMKGKWCSGSRTRKIVDASGFPVGWTVAVGLRYKDGRVLFEYRDWRSPDGTLWSSFKDASAFLLSSIGQHPTSSEMVVLLKHGPEMIRGEGNSSAMRERTNETVCACSEEDLTSITSVAAVMDPPRNSICSPRLGEALDETGVGSAPGHGGFSNEPVSSIQVDDGCPNFTGAATAAVVASHAETSGPEGCHIQTSTKVETLDSEQSSCYMCSRPAHDTFLGRHSCPDHTVHTPNPSKDADLKGLSKIPHFGSASWGIENIKNSDYCKIEGAQNCTGLTHSHDSPHKSSTLLKLRGHLRRINNGRPVKCDVCGRRFSSFAALFGHRVITGHPRATRVTSVSRRQQAKISEPVSGLRGSKMLNIVLGLLSDADGGVDCNGNHASVPEKIYCKPTKLLRSTDILKIGNDKAKQGKEKDRGLSSTFACEICHKSFDRQSQYWGHMSSHSKLRKKAQQSSAPRESVSKRPLGRVAGVESSLAMVAREDRECEAGAKHAVESVFWRLLDDASGSEEHKHELDLLQH